MDNTEKNSPDRKCLVTGNILSKEEMIRFVIGPDDSVVPDIENRLPGRGFWVKSEYETVKKACSGNVFARRAKKNVSVSTDIPEMIEKLLVRRCVNFLGLAHKAGLVTTGFEKVREAVKKNKAYVFVAASDAADNGLEKLIRLASGRKVIETLPACDISNGLGKERAVYAVLAKSALTENFIKECARLEKYRKKQ